MSVEPPPKRFAALEWPNEWVRDEKFWREVATRSLAGVIAIAVLGIPSLFYLWIAGQLPAATAFTILIGLGMVGVGVLVWWMFRTVIQAAERRRLRRVLGEDPNVSGVQRSKAEFNLAVMRYLERRRAGGDPFGEDFEATLKPRDTGLFDNLTERTKIRMEHTSWVSAALVWVAAVASMVVVAVTTFLLFAGG